jgi:glycosyltransferase involved in cell wall biosynthesis
MAGASVRVLGWQPDTAVQRALAESTAVVIAGEEDFGLVTAEAQASGRPPVAYASGGACEIVEDGVTGFLFHEQTPEAIAAAMRRAQDVPIDVADLRLSAGRFDVPVFLEAFNDALKDACRGAARTAAGAALSAS